MARVLCYCPFLFLYDTIESLDLLFFRGQNRSAAYENIGNRL